jgi:hypothetical protein
MLKKPLLTVIFCALLSVLMGQTLPFEIDFSGCVTCRPDSIASFSFSSNEDSIKSNLTTFTYEEDSSLVRYKYYANGLFSGNFIYYGFGYSISDENCNEIENAILERDFEFGDYYGYNRFYYFRPNSNIIDSSLVLFRSGGSPNHFWKNSAKTIWKYNADDKIEEVSYFNWLGLTTPYWACEDKEMHTYDDSLGNKLITYLKSNNGDAWVPKFTRKYNFDSEERITEVIFSSVTTNHGLYKTTYDFSVSDSIIGRNFTWDSLSNEWILRSMHTKVYDFNNHLSNIAFNPLNSQNSHWSNLDYSYLNDTECIEYSLQSNSDDGAIWENYQSKVYYYPSSVGINVPENRLDFNIYPNPTADNFTLASPIGAMIKIINSQGQVVLQTVANEEVTGVNMGNQPSGVYYVSLQNGNQISGKVLHVIR